MMIKQTLKLIAVPLLCAGSAQASSVSLDFVNLDPLAENDAVASGGVSGGIAEATVSSGLPMLSNYTITGFDLNGDLINDTFNFTLMVTGTNGGSEANVGIRGSGGNNGWHITTNNSGIEVGETISFAVTGESVTLGTGGGASLVMPTISFDGFSELNVLFGLPGERFSIDGNVQESSSNPEKIGLTDLDAFTFAAETPVSPATVSSYQLNEIGLSYTFSIPEPSSTALLGLGGLAVLLRRRK